MLYEQYNGTSGTIVDQYFCTTVTSTYAQSCYYLGSLGSIASIPLYNSYVIFNCTQNSTVVLCNGVLGTTDYSFEILTNYKTGYVTNGTGSVYMTCGVDD